MGRARAAAAVSASRRSCSLRRIGGPAAAKPVGGGAEASAGGARSGAVPAGPLCSVRSTERASGVSLSPTGHLRHPGRGWSRRVESHGRAQLKNLGEDRRDQPVVSFIGCYATFDNRWLSELATRPITDEIACLRRTFDHLLSVPVEGEARPTDLRH